ncbi:hypothetical protein MRB53_021226 [Persea americana]|uniref:Uncharacterized protein n=1 Tax=Persea americana TaxID=3435 RepID=A0ACC2L390_PERAE|nr:hypothetical protein MRB53_021226 [Persea americana]
MEGRRGREAAGTGGGAVGTSISNHGSGLLSSSPETTAAEQYLQRRQPVKMRVAAATAIGVVKILLDKESNFIPQADLFGNTVFHYASAKCYYYRVLEDKKKARPWSQVLCQIKILELLLEANPSLAYVLNRNGDYPLFIAIRKDFDLAVGTILDHCPGSAELVNQKGQHALHLAVMEKNWIILSK